MDKLRTFLQSWPGKVIMVVTLVPMAFLGVQGTFGGRTQPNQLIKVGEATVDLNTFQGTLTQRQNQLVEQGISPSLINQEALSNEVLRVLVERTLLKNQAQKLGMTVSDEAITRMLQEDSTFHDANGQFSNDIFAQFLQNNRLNKEILFQNFRTDLTLHQLNTGILGTAIYPNNQISRLLDLQLQTRELWVHRFAWQDYADQVVVTDTQVEEYFKENKENLIKPATVDLTYIELDPLLLKTDVPTEEEIQAQYTLYLKENGISDGRMLAQILLTGDDAQNKANEIYAKLQKGESFETLAKKHSADPSGKSGGQIGAFNANVFGKDAVSVEQALAGLKVGEYSKPVKTGFGYQIFKVTQVSQDAPKIENIRDQLIDRAVKYKQKMLFADLADKINGMTTDGVGIVDIAKEIELEVRQIANYPQSNNTTVLPQPAIISAAFDEFTIQDQGVSPGINLGEKTVWLQPSNYQASRALTLEEAKSSIKMVLAKQKAIELAMADANQKMADAKVSGISKLMTPSSAFGLVTRNHHQLNLSEIASLFLQRNENGQDIWVVQTENGASLLVGNPIHQIDQSQLSAADRLRAVRMIYENAGADQLQDYVQYLKDTNEVVINEEALQAQK